MLVKRRRTLRGYCLTSSVGWLTVDTQHGGSCATVDTTPPFWWGLLMWQYTCWPACWGGTLVILVQEMVGGGDQWRNRTGNIMGNMRAGEGRSDFNHQEYLNPCSDRFKARNSGPGRNVDGYSLFSNFKPLDATTSLSGGNQPPRRAPNYMIVNPQRQRRALDLSEGEQILTGSFRLMWICPACVV